jgi:hypothetical protein
MADLLAEVERLSIENGALRLVLESARLGETTSATAVERRAITWEMLNHERGSLIDKNIAGTLNSQERVHLEALNAYADRYLEQVAPRPDPPPVSLTDTEVDELLEAIHEDDPAAQQTPTAASAISKTPEFESVGNFLKSEEAMFREEYRQQMAELEARAEKAEAEVDRLRKVITEEDADLAKAEADGTRLTAEVKRLRAALYLIAQGTVDQGSALIAERALEPKP